MLDKYPFHERLYFTTSLAKGFAAAGGALVFPNAEMRGKVENWDGTMTFAGPIQPAMLGAGIASAKIHLSAEITERQHDVLGEIQCFLKREERKGTFALEKASKTFRLNHAYAEFLGNKKGRRRGPSCFENKAVLF